MTHEWLANLRLNRPDVKYVTSNVLIGVRNKWKRPRNKSSELLH